MGFSLGKNWLRKLIREEISYFSEYGTLKTEAIGKIEEILKKYESCKIGKTGEIETRFNTDYRDEKFKDLLGIVKSSRMKIIDDLEVELITHFGVRVVNIKREKDKSMTETGDYWIYIVHKGLK